MDQSHSIPSQWEQEIARLREENESLLARLEDAQETLRAIQEGAVDALVKESSAGKIAIQADDPPDNDADGRRAVA